MMPHNRRNCPVSQVFYTFPSNKHYKYKFIITEVGLPVYVTMQLTYTSRSELKLNDK